MWQNVVNPNNQYYELIDNPRSRDIESKAIPLRRVRFIDDDGNVIHPSMDPAVIEEALRDPEVLAAFEYFR
jgi:hypothetical protein